MFERRSEGGLSAHSQPVVQRLAAEERFKIIYTALRQRISLLDYAPGKRLSEVELAKEFQVSRTPIRRVLGRLESEGLVEIRHGAGTFVTEIELDYLCEVYQLRMELVTCMYLLLPKRVTDDLLERMRDTQQRCVNIPKSANAKRNFARLNIEFFEQLMELVGNRPLREMLDLLFYRAARMWPFLMNEDLVSREAETFHKEIGEVICLLEAGSVACVGQLRRKHIGMALQRLLDMCADEDSTLGVAM